MTFKIIKMVWTYDADRKEKIPRKMLHTISSQNDQEEDLEPDG